MDKEQQLYLPPEQQLIIGAKVNRLCEVSVEEFDPETQVADAEEIVRALQPRMKPTNQANAELNMTHKSDYKIMAGETGFGQVNTNFDSTESINLKLGIEEYRIGGYVAKLRVFKSFSGLEFEHFWDRGLINEAFEQESVSHCIAFGSDYKISSIYRERSSRVKFFWIISKIFDHQLELYPEKGRVDHHQGGYSIDIRL